jgi:hypothetical protein
MGEPHTTRPKTDRQFNALTFFLGDGYGRCNKNIPTLSSVGQRVQVLLCPTKLASSTTLDAH